MYLFDQILWTSILNPAHEPAQVRKLQVGGAAATTSSTAVIIPPLEPLNTVTGFPAALLTRARHQRIPATLYLVPLESGVNPHTEGELLYRPLDRALIGECGAEGAMGSVAERELQLHAQKLALSSTSSAAAVAASQAGKRGGSGPPPASRVPSNHLYL
jgi:hypothetical protein